MFIDWNGNGEIDPMDIGLTLAILDEEERLRAEEEQAELSEAERLRTEAEQDELSEEDYPSGFGCDSDED